MSTITLTPLERAQNKLYSIAGGSIDSGNVRASRLTTAQRIEYFRSPEFSDWIAYEKACGREVFWLKDVDKTQGAGDIFTFFFKWRADNNKFTRPQLKVVADFLAAHKAESKNKGKNEGRKPLFKRATGWVGAVLCGAQSKAVDLSPHEVLRVWLSKEDGGAGIGMMDFWTNVYWPSQIGLSKAEKLAQVNAFAPLYTARAYPGVREENLLLESLGVNVVIVSNGDQELAIAVAHVLGVKPENVVGSHLKYDSGGISTGVNHSYEVGGDEWHHKPQPGKSLSFHYWLHVNRARFGWKHIDERKFVIAGRDGDSAATDGGMMMYLQTAAIGNFMVNTPGEPGRLEKFYQVASKYGWTKGQFITLDQSPSQNGFRP